MEENFSVSLNYADVLWGFDSFPGKRVVPNMLNAYILRYTVFPGASFSAGTALFIRNDGTMLLKTHRHSGMLNENLSSSTQTVLPDKVFEDIKILLNINEQKLERIMGNASWTGWPVEIAYKGRFNIMDKSQYDDDKYGLKPIIGEIVNLIMKTGTDITLQDFWI